MRLAVLASLALLFHCGCSPPSESLDDLKTRTVTLPDGAQIQAEVLIDPAEMARGMMFRDALPRGHGLLFVHEKPAAYRYWMSNVKVPLDIIFMDSNHQIVEISANTPPCTTEPKDCPLYGGHNYEQFVLELGAGEAQRLGLQKGQMLSF